MKEAIAKSLSKITGMNKNDIIRNLEKPKYSNLGDISFPCFALAKKLKKSPYMLAEEIASSIGIPSKGILKIQALGGYVNFFLNKEILAEKVLNDILKNKKKYGSSTMGKNKTIVIDYSSPNIAKPMTIGHLRSTIIGNSLYRIFKFLGYKCVGINYLGDYGTQFGKILCAYDKWGKLLGSDLEKKPIESLLKLYLKFNKEAEKNPFLEDEAREWFRKMEKNDKKAIALWRKFRKLSLRDFKKFYSILGVHFDVYSGESQFKDKAKKVLEELKAKGIAIESEGAWIIPFGKNKPPLLVEKKDGTSLYSTRDIAVAEEHFKKYKFLKKLYVVATEQNLYFKQLFSTLERMGYRWSKDCVHVSFGMIYLPQGKISTRSGNIVFLEDVLEKIFKMAEELSKNSALTKKEIKKVSKAVGVSALIYSDLSNDRKKDIKFDWNNILRMEGNSGPYIQYSNVRALSILSKAKRKSYSFEVPLLNDSEKQLTSLLFEFPEIVKSAADHYAPHLIANYLAKLSDEFNKFYECYPVLNTLEEFKNFRIALTKAVSQVLENGMLLLGMIPLRKM